jgi:hypothetical protein
MSLFTAILRELRLSGGEWPSHMAHSSANDHANGGKLENPDVTALLFNFVLDLLLSLCCLLLHLHQPRLQRLYVCMYACM